MSGSNQLAVWLPFILGALLVGGALLGGFLSVTRRLQVERRVLWPLYVMLMVAGAVLAFERGIGR